jgi:hypothetical protein
MRTRFSKWLNSPAYAIFLGGVVALCLSAYPVMFMGKSFVSPGYGPPLLYNGLPFVPGYHSTDTEDLSADHGAMPWQNLPYSRVQYESVFNHGEFPLWNRYNTGGVPLFGQGQSQILDPIHWIAVAGQGNSWAWDTKFLLSKLVFLLGIGACIFLLTRSRLIAITLTVSAAFIGFFYFRFNHPVFFNLTYAPWVAFFYLLWVQNIRSTHRLAASGVSALPLIGVFVASVLHLFAGTPKEGIILFGALHFAGFVGVGLAALKSAGRRHQMGLLLLLWTAIALTSAPHWLVFLDTLSVASTIYDNPDCNYYSRPWQFVDSLFLGRQSRPWSAPVINVFIFVAGVHALFGRWKLYKRPEFWLVILPLAGLLGFAFGLVPNAVCQKIPFIGAIHHINDTFFTAALPFAILLAGFGLHQFLQDLSSRWGRFRRLSITLVVGVVLISWALKYYDGVEDWLNASGMLAVSGIAGTILLFLAALWLLHPEGVRSRTSLIALGALFVLTHFYHGLHPETGWENLDDLIINPTPRANLLEPSPAVNSLGYLLPASQLGNPSDTVKAVIGTARANGGRAGLITEYREDLDNAITSSSNSVSMQHHAANFLRGVGARRWLGKPARVLGIGLAPMSGFYSFLQLESLNGPDALMNPRYLEFLDLMGWRLAPGEVWLRTMDSYGIHQHELLLDVLNVGYLMSWRKDIDTLHLVSEYIRYSDFSTERPAIDSGEPPRPLLARQSGSADRVACRPRGLEKDGLADNVFTVDIVLPEELLPGVIEALRVERKTPSGVNHTGGNDFVLGVAAGENLPLLNRDNGGIALPVDTTTVRWWLFGCSDGLDDADTEYRVRAAYRSKRGDLQMVVDLDMKVWERQSAWPRAFFVNQVAKYDTPAVLADFMKESDGLPLAALLGDQVIPPVANRQVVPAGAYMITSNSTTFDIAAPSSGVIVLTEANLPGHVRAIVNGKPAEVFTVNHAFRGVNVPGPGQYTVRFIYRPTTWRLSWSLAIAGCLLLGLLVYLVRRLNQFLISSDPESLVHQETSKSQ